MVARKNSSGKESVRREGHLGRTFSEEAKMKKLHTKKKIARGGRTRGKKRLGGQVS